DEPAGGGSGSGDALQADGGAAAGHGAGVGLVEVESGGAAGDVDGSDGVGVPVEPAQEREAGEARAEVAHPVGDPARQGPDVGDGGGSQPGDVEVRRAEGLAADGDAEPEDGALGAAGGGGRVGGQAGAGPGGAEPAGGSAGVQSAVSEDPCLSEARKG